MTNITNFRRKSQEDKTIQAEFILPEGGKPSGNNQHAVTGSESDPVPQELAASPIGEDRYPVCYPDAYLLLFLERRFEVTY